MKHASARTLDALPALLQQLRLFSSLRERKPGAFYRGSSAFLHFHEDPAGLFVDVKLDHSGFTRLPIDTPIDQAALVAAVARALCPPKVEAAP